MADWENLTPDAELVDDRLEEGESYTVRARCVGHPLGMGGGCGWSGTAQRSAREMPSCPQCGGWAEPEQAKGGLRVVE